MKPKYSHFGKKFGLTIEVNGKKKHIYIYIHKEQNMNPMLSLKQHWHQQITDRIMTDLCVNREVYNHLGIMTTQIWPNADGHVLHVLIYPLAQYVCVCVCVRADSIPPLTCLMCVLGCRSHTDFCAEPTRPHRAGECIVLCLSCSGRPGTFPHS